MGEELPPVRVVRELVAAGAVEVALHDLDGTFASDVVPEWVQTLVAVAGVPVRFDGRLQDGDRIERIARAGFSTIVVDQAAAFDAILLRWALDLYGDRLCAEIRADGPYVFDPPTAAFGIELVDVLVEQHFQGVRRFLYRDVTGEALPLQRLLELGDRLPGAKLSLQGRIETVGDIDELMVVGHLLDAVLVSADHVLEGALDLAAANRAVSPSGPGRTP